jgi:hypothetical protein
MLQLLDGAIRETTNTAAFIDTTVFGNSSQTLTVGGTTGLTVGSVQYWPYTTYWNSYPVYICTDKTAKAIEVLKALQSEKLLKCDSVPRFIQLVEKIAGLL